MAIGDVVSDLQTITAGTYLDILPTGTAEWVIHNVYHSSDAQIEFYDGSISSIFDASTGSGSYSKQSFHCTSVRRIRVKNTTISSINIGYDGIVTHL